MTLWGGSQSPGAWPPLHRWWHAALPSGCPHHATLRSQAGQPPAATPATHHRTSQPLAWTPVRRRWSCAPVRPELPALHMRLNASAAPMCFVPLLNVLLGRWPPLRCLWLAQHPCSAVKATVNTGRVVVCTIHQPSIEIFSVRTDCQPASAAVLFPVLTCPPRAQGSGRSSCRSSLALRRHREANPVLSPAAHAL